MVDIGGAKSMNMKEAINESGENRFCITSARTDSVHIVARRPACTGIDWDRLPRIQCANWAAF